MALWRNRQTDSPYRKSFLERTPVGPRENGNVLAIVGNAQLPNNAIKRSSATLRATNVMIGTGGTPEHGERPPLRAVRDQASQGQAYLDSVDLAFARAGDRRTQDMQRKVDNDPLMT